MWYAVGVPGLDHFRAELRHRVTLAAHITGQESQEVIPCLLLDLGMGGAQVSCSDSFPEGALASLTLTAPFLWEPFALPVRVAWVRSEPDDRTILGLQFQPQTGAQLLVLAELLREHDRY